VSRALSNVLVEAIARRAFPELAECSRLWTLARRCGDVRDELDGIACATVTGQERERIRKEARAAGIEIAAPAPAVRVEEAAHV
jgi:hypothetical protein